MTSHDRPRRRRGPRGDLSADVLAAAADRVLRADGLAGLTLRSVARAAGVTPTVLYTYFDDMAGLRNRLGDDFLGGLDLSLLRADPPAEALRTFLHHLLAHFRSSPGHVQLLATQRIAGPHALALNEALLELLEDRVGHPVQVAADMTVFLTQWVHGTLLLLPSDAPDDAFRTELSRLDLSPYPRTVRMPPDTDGAGIELVVRALVPDGR